jgi:hypothetical protein
MWFRRGIGVTFGLLILGLGFFLSFEELRGSEPPRWWFPGFAVIPGTLILELATTEPGASEESAPADSQADAGNRWARSGKTRFIALP